MNTSARKASWKGVMLAVPYTRMRMMLRIHRTPSTIMKSATPTMRVARPGRSTARDMNPGLTRFTSSPTPKGSQ